MRSGAYIAMVEQISEGREVLIMDYLDFFNPSKSVNLIQQSESTISKENTYSNIKLSVDEDSLEGAMCMDLYADGSHKVELMFFKEEETEYGTKALRLQWVIL